MNLSWFYLETLQVEVSMVVLIHVTGARVVEINYWVTQDCYKLSESMSEWLLFNAISTIFQLYHIENKLIFNEMIMISALY